MQYSHLQLSKVNVAALQTRLNRTQVGGIQMDAGLLGNICTQGSRENLLY